MNKQAKTVIAKKNNITKKIAASYQQKVASTFDPEKDKCLRSIVIDANGNNKIKYTVGVYSYNDGEPKVGFNKQVLTADGTWGFSGIGRLTQADAISVAKAIVTILGGK